MHNNNGHNDENIVYSQSFKAGKRIYYIDVKSTRMSEFYIQITESKRIKQGDEENKPVFEKHKVFLFQEDMEQFTNTLTDAINFVKGKIEESGKTLSPREVFVKPSNNEQD